MSGNTIAPDGQIFVCLACGKKSKGRYGGQKTDRGWDVSCVINSVLCYEEKDIDGFYIPVDESMANPPKVPREGD